MNSVIPMRNLPPEFEAAKSTVKAASHDALSVSGAVRQQIVGYCSIALVGAILGSSLIALNVISAGAAEFWKSATTVLAVLSGFMIATMVFTGKIEAAKSLSLTELRQVSAKINYMLLYQMVTLANHLSCIVLMLMVPWVYAKFSYVGNGLAGLAFGILLVSIVRSMLIPAQIIELHRFTHAALLRDKAREVEEELEDV